MLNEFLRSIKIICELGNLPLLKISNVFVQKTIHLTTSDVDAGAGV